MSTVHKFLCWIWSVSFNKRLPFTKMIIGLKFQLYHACISHIIKWFELNALMSPLLVRFPFHIHYLLLLLFRIERKYILYWNMYFELIEFRWPADMGHSWGHWGKRRHILPLDPQKNRNRIQWQTGTVHQLRNLTEISKRCIQC